MAVGFDPATQEIRWSRSIPAGDPRRAKSDEAKLNDLHDGTFFATYEVREGSRRLIAIDARSGDTLWDVAVPRSQDGSEERAMVVTATRIYIPHWTWLEVMDRSNGTHLGTIGSW
jgi:outer membrane protein assembly factor BamB